MRLYSNLAGLALCAVTGVSAVASLSEVCTDDYVTSILDNAQFPIGSSLVDGSVVTVAVTNFTVSDGGALPASGLDYCNVTFSYIHEGSGYEIGVYYLVPSPEQFQGRFLTTGGDAYTIGDGWSQYGLAIGAVTGATDGGWPIGTDLTDYLLLANGTINWERLYAFAYQATYEMTIIGKSMTTAFYNVSSFYTYYDGCSEGGRGGQAQIQRFGDVYDGALIGAPAMVHSFSQTFHIFPQVMEVEMDTYPSTCEFDAILTDTIDFCDGLDGLADGVISRSDLCFLNYNATHAVGNSFSCSETEQSGMVGSAQPAINGTVSLAAAELVNTIYAGVFDSKGRQVYISYQTGSELSDAVTTYDSATNTYSAVAGGIGVLFVNYFLNEVPTEAMSLENVTTDTIRDWMLDGYQKFSDSLQTNWPDLTDFSDHGGKVIHIHGESDDSVPTANSVYYHDSVRQVMYPDLGFNESYASLHDFYRLFLVPGAGHCAPGFVQTNSSWPSDAIYNLMAWVENGTEPDLLPSAQETGGTVELCLWPLRPLYTSNGTLSCVYDEQSIDTWLPDLNSIPMPVW